SGEASGMTNDCGVHVGEGVGEDCVASGPAQRQIATASNRGRMATVRGWIKFSLRGPTVYQNAVGSVKPATRVRKFFPIPAISDCRRNTDDSFKPSSRDSSTPLGMTSMR